MFQIYNYALDSNSRPDLEVRYDVYRRIEGAEKPFNKIASQLFNAKTLPPNFDTKRGHQLVGGHMVPLKTFDPGEYRVEITVEDRLAHRQIVRNVVFHVVDDR
jgi:hypothetical protein